MTRVEAASGVNYTAQKQAPRKFEPIAPTGTNYTPVGKVDIAALRRGPASSPAAPPPAPAAAKPFGSPAPRAVPLAPSPAPGIGRAPVSNKAPADAWADEADSFAPPPPPAASRPPTFGAPKPAASVRASLHSYDPHTEANTYTACPCSALYPCGARTRPVVHGPDEACR